MFYDDGQANRRYTYEHEQVIMRNLHGVAAQLEEGLVHWNGFGHVEHLQTHKTTRKSS
jgi:hypothetical protein